MQNGRSSVICIMYLNTPHPYREDKLPPLPRNPRNVIPKRKGVQQVSYEIQARRAERSIVGAAVSLPPIGTQWRFRLGKRLRPVRKSWDDASLVSTRTRNYWSPYNRSGSRARSGTGPNWPRSVSNVRKAASIWGMVSPDQRGPLFQKLARKLFDGKARCLGLPLQFGLLRRFDVDCDTHGARANCSILQFPIRMAA